MNNKKSGNSFERELAKTLADHGFWVHILAQNQAGQPFDIIAARNGKVYPIDGKVCANDCFRLERVEENQKLSMWRWFKTGNLHGWFALKLSNGDIYMVSDGTIQQYFKDRIYTMSRKAIETYGYLVEEWVQIY